MLIPLDVKRQAKEFDFYRMGAAIRVLLVETGYSEVNVFPSPKCWVYSFVSNKAEFNFSMHVPK